MASVFDAFIRIRAVNEASNVLRKISGDLGGLEKKAATFSKTLALAGAASVGAGLGIAFGLKSIVGPAELVEEQLHRLRNTLAPGAVGMKDLADAQQASAQWSTKLGIAQEGLLKQIYLGTSAGLSMADSLKAMTVASQVAQGMGGDLEETQRTLNLAFINFRDPSKSAADNIQNLGDVMAYATAKFDYKNVEELRSQLELATPTALSAGMGFKDLVATLADFTRHGLTGSVAGEALEESMHGVLLMQEKLGIPLARNTQGGIDLARSLTNVREHFIQLHGSMKAIPVPVLQQIQQTFGERGLRALLIQKDEFNSIRSALDSVNVAGFAQKASNEMLKSPKQQFKLLGESIRQVFIQAGFDILPMMMRLVGALIPLAHSAQAFAKAHAGWVKMAAVTAMIGSAVLILGGTLAIATAAMSGFTSFGTLISTMCESLQLGAVFTKAWAAAQWVLDAAMSANPLALAVIGIVALGVAVGYLLNHWQKVKDAFHSSVSFFEGIGSSILHALVNPFVQLPGAIKAAWGGIRTEVFNIAGKISRFFQGHSPIPEGPLHTLNLGRDIARTLKPQPVLNAVRATAAAVALAIPLMAPSIGVGSAYAGDGSGAITIHFSPVININPGAGGGDTNLPALIREELKRSADYVAQQIDKVRTRKSRLDF